MVFRVFAGSAALRSLSLMLSCRGAGSRSCSKWATSVATQSTRRNRCPV